MKAIETSYKGCRFRSRLEARWAVFFDQLGIRWEYEPRGFQFDDGSGYLPDFWLPNLRLWVEVKPDAPTPHERLKAIALIGRTGRPVFITSGMPGRQGEICWLFAGAARALRDSVWANGWVNWSAAAEGACELIVDGSADDVDDSEIAHHGHTNLEIRRADHSFLREDASLSGEALYALRKAQAAEFGESGV